MRYALAFLMFLMFSEISSGTPLNQGEMVLIGSQSAGYLMYTPVLIDGVEHLAFIDTGSVMSAIYRSVSQKREVIDSITSRGLFSDMKADITLARTLSFPGSTHANTKLAIKHDPHADLRLPMRASSLIGADILGKKPLLLDFSSEVITHVAGAEATGSTLIHARFVNNLPVIDVSLNGKKVSALLDTGATISAIDEKLLGEEGGLSKIAGMPRDVSDTFGVTRVAGVRELEVAVRPGRTVRARFAGVDLSPLADRAGLKIDAILGMDVVAQHDWLIDYPNRRVFMRDPVR